MDQFDAESWDALRKQARKLESELDGKLSSFRKAMNAPGKNLEATLECEIEKLLQRLEQINLQMQSWVSFSGSDLLSHTLARHKDISNELTQEFQRLRSGAKAKREHEQLLESFGTGEEKANSSRKGSTNGMQQMLLEEQGLLHKSTAEVDGVIGQAHVAFDALMTQRSTFKDIGVKIHTLGSKLPDVNGILTSIRRKKSKDTIILSLVASLCTTLILIYWLSK